VVESLRKICAEVALQATTGADRSPTSGNVPTKLDSVFFNQKSTQIWYSLEVTYALLMPAYNTVSEEVCEFQVSLEYKTWKWGGLRQEGHPAYNSCLSTPLINTDG
jgi:hypothetical protein